MKNRKSNHRNELTFKERYRSSINSTLIVVAVVIGLAVLPFIYNLLSGNI